MLFWIVALLMLTIAVLCVLLPLTRRPSGQALSDDPLSVYREQLSEIEAEIESSGGESETLKSRKAEVARRILRHSRSQNPIDDNDIPAGRLTKVASATSLIVIPLLAMATYFYTGSPRLASIPQVASTSEPLADKSVEEMVLMAERHLAKNPDDARGWEVLANVYGRLNRVSDKAKALQELIRIAGPTAERLADLGEALTNAAGNIVPAKARELFDQALVLQPDMPKASLYLAVALEQEGKFTQALEKWQRLQANTANDPRWASMTAARIEQLQTRMGVPATPGPTASDVANASTLSQDDRNAMIESMVERLAGKLEENPDDFEGWLRLIRSYAVLKKTTTAQTAFDKAIARFGEDAEKAKQLHELKIELQAGGPEPEMAKP